MLVIRGDGGHMERVSGHMERVIGHMDRQLSYGEAAYFIQYVMNKMNQRRG